MHAALAGAGVVLTSVASALVNLPIIHGTAVLKVIQIYAAEMTKAIKLPNPPLLVNYMNQVSAERFRTQ